MIMLRDKFQQKDQSEAASRYRKRPISWVLFNLVLKVGVMISTDLSRKHNGSNVKFEVLQKTIKESFSRTSGEGLKQIYGELLKELYTYLRRESMR